MWSCGAPFSHVDTPNFISNQNGNEKQMLNFALGHTLKYDLKKAWIFIAAVIIVVPSRFHDWQVDLH